MTIDKLYILFLAQGQKITIDTRKIQKGQIYFALKGNNFNGNHFALEAIQKGARYAVVDEPSLKNHENIIFVDDVLTTLQELALYHRRKLNIPLIAITGSNGKTTTKELIKEVLSKKFKVAYTKGNLNNHIGIPLTILDIKAYEDISIVEMGANHQGEIKSYCTYTEPNFGLITNIGKAHLEGFGGIEGVIRGKTELYQYLLKSKGRIFLNIDDPILVEKSVGIESITYGQNDQAITYGEKITSVDGDFLSLKVHEDNKDVLIHTNLVGQYNLSNVLAAYCIGRFFEVSVEDIKSAIENYTPTNSRSQLIRRGSLSLILDAYNANPSSMEEALKNLSAMDGKRIAILGAMKELGEYSTLEHGKVVRLASSLGLERIILVGNEFEEFSNDGKFIHYFKTTEDAKEWFISQVWKDEIILIKGSRGMALENILE